MILYILFLRISIIKITVKLLSNFCYIVVFVSIQAIIYIYVLWSPKPRAEGSNPSAPAIIRAQKS